MHHRLAQISVDYLRYPPDAPELREFWELLAQDRELSGRAPGFLWRLPAEDEELAARASEDARLVIDLCVWESVELLWAFTFRGPHLELVAHRHDWFEPHVASQVALWWVPGGALPTVEEGERRLRHLAEHGPTPTAFTFATRFTPEGTPV
jgi:hypothetical protein